MTLPVRRNRPSTTSERPLGWTARNPLAEFDDLLNQMSGLLESTVGSVAPAAVAWTPLADVTEDDDAYRIEIELPGVKSSDINVDTDGQELVVRGEIKEKERQGILRRGSRRTGAFEYRVRLPEKVNTDEIAAEMEDGVLTITVPKAEVATHRRIEVTQHKDTGRSGG
ncbi:heat-shock protein [Streptomyces hygroscopicus]|uniref:Hsp20/alpha crystallin family protein n=1 Tax=Streptomyces hygroscopicus TaxID=1912 RepID=UPI00223F4F81|nr:Hsp20/alpha crystallin family protein [Streptomyces hygroscopicus]MCW7940791.1 heat-shock protein [Streptomyces hygroscopicus]